MKPIENLKRSIRYFILRMSLLGVLVVLGAMSIAQTQRDRTARETPPTKSAPTPLPLQGVRDQGGASLASVEVAADADPAELSQAEGSDVTAEVSTDELRAESEAAPATWSQPDPAEPAQFETSSQHNLVGSEPQNHAQPAQVVAYDRSAKANPLRHQELAPSGEVPPLMAGDAPAQEGESYPDASTAEGDEAAPGENTDPAMADPGPVAEPYSDQPQSPPPAEHNYPDSTFQQPSTFEQPPATGEHAPAEMPSEPAGTDAALAEQAPIEPAPFHGSHAAPGPLPQRAVMGNESTDPPAYASESLAQGTPGPKEFEGPQTPSIIVQKEVPEEIQVGQTARMALRIRNVGQITAHHVMVRDQVPRGAKLIKTSPEARRDQDGTLLWNVDTLPPGKEVVVEMHVEPVDEGRIGSVATVAFEANATASTLVTKPNLTIQQTGPQQVMIGDMVRFAIQISNPGTGTAEHVVLQEDVPTGLSHTAGRKLEYEVGAIRPGETRHLELALKAAQPGQVENLIYARADGNIQVQHTAQVEIISPELRVRIEGPNRRYLQRSAVYTVNLENPGTAAANNIDLLVQLPEGLKFVNTNNSGNYEPARHAIQWNLASLPSKKRGKVQFTVSPSEMGDHKIVATAQAELGLADKQEHLVSVDGVPALLFSVADASDPVEVGGQTSYEIHIVNQGSKAATNVRLVADLPEGLEAVRAEGATNGNVTPQRVEFSPVAQLVPQQELKFRVDVRGVRDGDWRFTVNMTSDETSTPVTKQESTHVYSDQ